MMEELDLSDYVFDVCLIETWKTEDYIVVCPRTDLFQIHDIDDLPDDTDEAVAFLLRNKCKRCKAVFNLHSDDGWWFNNGTVDGDLNGSQIRRIHKYNDSLLVNNKPYPMDVTRRGDKIIYRWSDTESFTLDLNEDC